jgi:hypothetical protein
MKGPAAVELERSRQVKKLCFDRADGPGDSLRDGRGHVGDHIRCFATVLQRMYDPELSV